MMHHYDVTGGRRRELAQAIGSILGKEVKYCGAPSFAYKIDTYTLSRDGVLSWNDLDDADPEHFDQSVRLIQSLEELGYRSAELDFFAEQEAAIVEHIHNEDVTLRVSMPRDSFTDGQLENLRKLVDAKAPLLKEALGVTCLPIEVTDEAVSFAWFTGEITAESYKAYTDLITALCRMAREAKRVTAKEKETTNPKYEFRCFLLRLGFIGDEHKQTRKILLQNLSGSSAFKGGAKNAVSE